MVTEQFQLRLASAQDTAIAGIVADLTQQYEKMVPRDQEAILGIFGFGFSALVLDGDNLVSHAGVIEVAPNLLEICSVVTNPEYQNQGAAGLAVHAVLYLLGQSQEHVDKSVIAFVANKHSIKIFEGRFKGVRLGGSLEPDLKAACGGCKYEQSTSPGCCNKRYDLTQTVRSGLGPPSLNGIVYNIATL